MVSARISASLLMARSVQMNRETRPARYDTDPVDGAIVLFVFSPVISNLAEFQIVRLRLMFLQTIGY